MNRYRQLLHKYPWLRLVYVLVMSQLLLWLVAYPLHETMTGCCPGSNSHLRNLFIVFATYGLFSICRDCWRAVFKKK